MASENQVHLHNLKDFLRMQTPETLGVIWIDNSDLKEQELAFSWLNYLFNGTLELQNAFQSNDLGSLFLTNQFGHNFYLGIVKDEELPSFLKQFVQTVQCRSEDIKKVNVLLKKDQTVSKKLLKDKTPYELNYMTY